MPKKYQTFKDFYPFYLSQHANKVCRRLHFFGTLCIILIVCYTFFTQDFYLLWSLPIIGYGFAWIGHFFFEKNNPATFTYPFYSLLGDWIMFKDMLFGKVTF